MATISINARCADCCQVRLIGDPTRPNAEHLGYVPRNLGIGSSDYIELEIDLETGKIVGWQKPTDKAIDDAFPLQPSKERSDAMRGLYPDKMGE